MWEFPLLRQHGAAFGQGYYVDAWAPILTTPMSTHTLPLDSPIPFEERSSTSNLSDDLGCPARFIRRALNIFLERDVPVPDPFRLTTIVKAALAAQHLFFAVSLHEPAQIDLDSFFDTFVMSCAQRPWFSSTKLTA